jgi:hypothetical protein
MIILLAGSAPVFQEYATMADPVWQRVWVAI